MSRVLRLCVLALLTWGLAACGGSESSVAIPTPEDPLVLLRQVIANLRQTPSFRLLIEQRGVPYPFTVTLDQGATYVNATMQRAEAQFLTPETLYANVRLALGGLPPIGVEIFARATDQWFRLAGSGWINYPVAQGFDPGSLIREDSGFSTALDQLRELAFVELTTLEDGTPVFHIRGLATGAVINDLLFELINLQNDNVIVDVYIEPQRRLPLLLSVVVPDTATNTQGNTEWRIELFDYGREASFSGPLEATQAPSEGS
ncbi:MAG: LppX_LprAFG lipoprotein [Anaerolineae bacterium]|nr:LppX_LprAFG lipoprotein [Anaerolineae bacterium]MDW8171728.1 LppX_LprAFG lipoprotein [Anaerolineae bacterium]